MLLQQGGDAELREAHNLARRAVELEPKNVVFRSTFVEVLMKAGLEKNATRELEIIINQPRTCPCKGTLKVLKSRRK